MQLGRGVRVVIALLVVVGVLSYAVIVELGLSAGRVHGGVSAGKLEVGGLTFSEAAEILAERGERVQRTPILFATVRFRRCLIPSEISWRPQPFATAQAAMRVGRRGGPMQALVGRIRAWIWGVKIPWQGQPSNRRITKVIDSWEREARAQGLEVRRWRLRKRIYRAVRTWPRRPFRIPLRRSGAGRAFSKEALQELPASCAGVPSA